MINHKSYGLGKYIEEQNALSSKICIAPLKKKIRIVTGLDASFSKEQIFACAVSINAKTLEVVEKRYVKDKIKFPYVPTFLYLREGPAYLKVIKKLKVKPDLLLIDGQGILHPREFGLACYVGILSNIPSVGVAKNRLIGEHKKVGIRKGDKEEVYVEGKIRGFVLRTRDRVKPLYVSPGHKINLEEAVKNVLKFCIKYRLPEPIRLAHLYAGTIKQT